MKWNPRNTEKERETNKKDCNRHPKREWNKNPRSGDENHKNKNANGNRKCREALKNGNPKNTEV